MDLRRGGSVTLSITVSDERGGVAGQVTGTYGQPFPGAVVTLVPDPTRWDWPDRYQELEADSMGRFTFEKVAPGRYRVFGWQDIQRGAAQDAEYRKPYEKFGVAVDVTANGKQAVELKAIDTGKVG